jgi:hypothetical protein
LNKRQSEVKGVPFFKRKGVAFFKRQAMKITKTLFLGESKGENL